MTAPADRPVVTSPEAASGRGNDRYDAVPGAATMTRLVEQHAPEYAVFHGLRVYGPARDGALVSRMQEIAKNDRRTPKMSRRTVVAARRALVKANMVERGSMPGQWRVSVGFESLSFEDAQKWAKCQHSGARRWLYWHEVRVERGYAVLYKAVRRDFFSQHGVRYQPGDKPKAPDWHDRATCDGGLFFWPTLRAAQHYLPNGRYMACRVRVDHLVTIGTDKCKAPRCTVLYECDTEAVAA